MSKPEEIQKSAAHSEMSGGTAAEQTTPLNTDSTTVSSSVKRIIIERVVSSLVAAAGAMQV